jgi:hypothetical protein
MRKKGIPADLAWVLIALKYGCPQPLETEVSLSEHFK